MNILITAPFDQKRIEQLREKHTVFYESWEETMVFGKGQPLIDRLNKDQIEILVTEVDYMDAEVLEACPKIKLICDCRGLPSNIDLETATEKNVIVTNTPGRNAVAVAELTLGLILSLARFIPTGHDLVEQGDWTVQAYFDLQGTEISQKTLGLIGFGAVSRALAKIVSGFDMKLLAYDPFVSQEAADQFNVSLVSLEELMSDSDIVSNHLPVTEETNGLISAELLASMKPTAFFINTGRTITVDEETMLELLKEGKIAGGAFDVFGKEPLPSGHRYAELPNAVFTPHIAGATNEIAIHQAIMVMEDIEYYLEGKRPPRQVN